MNKFVEQSSQNSSIQLPLWCNFIFIALIVGEISFLSFSQSGSAYFFPKLLASSLIIGLILDLLFSKFLETTIISFSKEAVIRLLPGLFLIVLTLYFLETIGFYIGSWFFLCISLIYYNEFSDHLSEFNQLKPVSKIWYKVFTHVIFSTLLMLGMYLLFSLALKVQIPQGIFL